MNPILDNALQMLAVAAPALTLFALNVALFFGGERGTLLLPSARPIGPVRRADNVVPPRQAPAQPAAPANDPAFRHAA